MHHLPPIAPLRTLLLAVLGWALTWSTTALAAGPPLAEAPAPVDEPVVAMTVPEGPEVPDAINGSFAVRSDVVLDDSLSPGNGRAMMFTGVALSGIGFAGQMIGMKVVHDRCDGFTEMSPEAVDFSSVQACGVGYQGGVAILLTSSLVQMAGAPWVIAGATRRGRYRAFQDYFVERRSNPRVTRPWVWGGAGMLAAGAAAWVVSPIVAVENCKNSTSLTCSIDATTWGYSVGLGLLTAGGATLGRALAYKYRFERFRERIQIDVRPQLSRSSGGVMLSGRF